MADYSDITTVMDVLVKRAKALVNDAYRCHKEGEPRGTSGMTSLVFPQYSTDDDESQNKQKKKKYKTRISEQELRFAFVQAFHEYKYKHHCNYLYGVEVPTKDKYLFTEEVEDKNDKTKKRRGYNPRIASDGRSGSFDMVIYNDKCERICLIEFKYGTFKKGNFSKDFLKLANPKEGKDAKRYFIHLKKDNVNGEETIIESVKQELKVNIRKVIYKPVIILNK